MPGRQKREKQPSLTRVRALRLSAARATLGAALAAHSLARLARSPGSSVASARRAVRQTVSLLSVCCQFDSCSPTGALQR